MVHMSFRNLCLGWLTVVMLAGAIDSALAAGEKTRAGVIQQLDFAAGTMIVDGYRYYSAPELRVEIGGSYGAFTMLQVGMKVQIVYRLVSESRRDLVEVKQIPDNFTIEGA